MSKTYKYSGLTPELHQRLDDEVDRIILKYRTRGKVGGNKVTVRKALYRAYALGV